MKKFTYEVAVPRDGINYIIGWRKSSTKAVKFAEQLLNTPTVTRGKKMYDVIVVSRRDRRPEDFD